MSLSTPKKEDCSAPTLIAWRTPHLASGSGICTSARPFVSYQYHQATTRPAVRLPSSAFSLSLAHPYKVHLVGRGPHGLTHVVRSTQEPSPRVTHTWRKNAVSPHSLRTSKEGRRRQEARRQLLFDGGLEWVAVARLRRLQRDDRRLDQCQVRRHWRLSGRPRKATRQPGGG